LANLAKLREQFDLPLIVLAFLVLLALERTEAFTLVEDELLSYRQTFRHAYGDQDAVQPLPSVRVIYRMRHFMRSMRHTPCAEWI